MNQIMFRGFDLPSLHSVSLCAGSVNSKNRNTQIDRARTILNLDFWWKYYSKLLGYSASCCHSYYSRARSIQEPIIWYFISMKNRLVALSCEENREPGRNRWPSFPQLSSLAALQLDSSTGVLCKRNQMQLPFIVLWLQGGSLSHICHFLSQKMSRCGNRSHIDIYSMTNTCHLNKEQSGISQTTCSYLYLFFGFI